MKDSTINRLTAATIITIGLITIGLVGLFGWAIIEIIQWITSK
jgi:uncharacterized membrane protein YuzA (DUF378 family)